MPYSMLVFLHRKAGTTPDQFKAYYEGTHIPLTRGLTGTAFPLTHTRRYPRPILLVGADGELDYDAVTEVTFEDESAFQNFFAVLQRPENAAKIAADEDNFIDRARLNVFIVGDTAVTERL
ncbi:EthD domain-containing protein [Nemania serpens]|nr:EthD domain-containing protein [Nemania serpens]